jgi:hypothetical protein
VTAAARQVAISMLEELVGNPFDCLLPAHMEISRGEEPCLAGSARTGFNQIP